MDLQAPATYVIDKFMENYYKEKSYYNDLAKTVGNKCKVLLNDRGIQSIVTWRAKNAESLRNKLIARQEGGKHYESSDSITNDIHDLAGVRIALYWPKDQRLVGKELLSEILEVDNERSFFERQSQEDKSQLPFHWQFQGYSAKHCICFLNPEDRESMKWKRDKVEIQIVSILRHTWAEVEHDIIYKPTREPLSTEEMRIIDGLSGVIHMGEWFLDQLSDIQGRQKAAANKAFENVFELGSCLSRITADVSRKEEDLGPLKALKSLLEIADLNDPEKLKTKFQALDSDLKLKEKAIDKDYKGVQLRPSISIIDYIVFRDPASEGILKEVLRQRTNLYEEATHRLQVIISTILWLDDFFCPSSKWQRRLCSPRSGTHNADQLEHLSWLGTARTQSIIQDSLAVTDQEKTILAELWAGTISKSRPYPFHSKHQNSTRRRQFQAADSARRQQNT